MTHDLGRLVARVRRLRAIHGDSATRRSMPQARGQSRNGAWAAFVLCWALCIILPLGAGLRVRSASGRPTAHVAEEPALTRDALVRLLDVSPVARLTARLGTAEVAAWSPDGRYLATGYSSGELLIWDVARRRLAGRIAAHRRFVGALSWSPDGRLLASAAADGRAVVWTVSGGRIGGAVLTVHTQRPRVPAVAFAPRGDTLAVADGGRTVTLWNLSARGNGRTAPNDDGLALAQTLSVSGRTTALAWSPDGARLAVGTLDGRVILWRRADNWRSAARSFARAVWALAWAPRADILAAGGADGTVSLLRGADLRPLSVLVAPFHRTPVMQVPDYGSPAPAPTKSKRTSKGLPRPAAGAAINALAWSPSGDLLSVTATGVPLRLWRPSSGAVVATYSPAWDQNAVAWRPDGTLAAVALDDGSVTLLRAAEPSFIVDTLCRLGPTLLCAAARLPLAPLGRTAPAPSYMGR